MSAGPLSEEKISHLLDLLYEAGASPQGWAEFLSEIRDALEANSAFFILVDPSRRCDFSLVLGIDPACQQTYAEYYNRRDVLYDRIIASLGRNPEWAGTAFCNFSESEFGNLEIYQDWVKPQGFYDQCAIALGGLDGGLEGGMGFHRVRRAKRFGPREVSLLSTLGPHLRRALNLHRTMTQLRNEKAELRESVEMLGLAILSLDGAGRVLRQTAAARAILDARDGLTIDRGHLRAAASAEQARLTEMIAGAAATGQGRGARVAIQAGTTVAPELGSRKPWTPHPGGAILISREPPKRP
ncbi:MAG TPA: hypothetical protein VHC90_18600, partial [Bryobacteraceae bacterium]|nr:hypothetical protein [Bryobacteraceae bacterium]